MSAALTERPNGEQVPDLSAQLRAEHLARKARLSAAALKHVAERRDHPVPQPNTERAAPLPNPALTIYAQRYVKPTASELQTLWVVLQLEGCGPFQIIRRVAAYFCVDADVLRGKSQKGYLPRVRRMVVPLVARANPHLTYTQIGRIFGGRESSSIAWLIDPSYRTNAPDERPQNVNLDVLIDDLALRGRSGREIIAAVANYYHVPQATVASGSQFKGHVFVRFVAMAIVAKLNPHLSLNQIGRLFGKDHTTVLSALRKMGVRS